MSTCQHRWVTTAHLWHGELRTCADCRAVTRRNRR